MATILPASLMHVEPVLPVADISETIAHWTEVLGFTDKWTWGEPPQHGGVSWHGVSIQFTLNAEIAARSRGNSVWVRVRNVAQLYSFHTQNNAEIVSKLEDKPWGFTEYTVLDINGYYVNFSAPAKQERQPRDRTRRPVRIVRRKPRPNEYLDLAVSIGWADNGDIRHAESVLATVMAGAVAEDADTGDVVGCVLLLGDNKSFYYVKDLMVNPAWQGQEVGHRLMEEITAWLDEKAAPNSMSALICAENMAAFYSPFGFAPAFAMVRHQQGK